MTAKAPIFFDMPEPGQADRPPAQVAKDAEAPDADLTAMLRSIFEAPQEGDEQEEVPHMEQPVHVTRPTEQPDHVAPPMEEPVPEAQPERVKAPSVAQEEPCAIVPSDWMVEHLGASKPMLSAPELPEHAELREPLAIAPPATALSAQEADDTDDWAVYFEKVPTPPRMPAQVIEIMPAAAVPAAPAHSRAGTTPQGPQPFDRTIDLVLVGEEKETFEIMAEEIEETVDSFETIKLIDVSPDPEPLLTAELRKLDPNAPDRRSFKLLPWIKRDETEEEMLERLTIKNVKFAG